MMDDPQISKSMREELTKQQYRFVGEHSAVKVCGWTKNSILGKGECYKFAFYGIRSHQCLQSTSSMYCASRCIFCWRGSKAPVSTNWYGPIDEPSFLVDGMIEAHKELVIGFKGNKKSIPKKVEEMLDVRHVALSLTGEPIVYPKINELLDEFHKKKISTFLVTNAQYPEEIKSIKNVTQLYLSIDAPNKKIFKEIDRPLFPDYYDRVLKSLDVLSTKKYRTCIRLTIIKDKNDSNYEEYSELINRGNPDFVEIKAYMNVGGSRENLEYCDMPIMTEIESFSNNLINFLSNYEIVSKHAPSRVILLKKKGVKQFINFRAFFETLNCGEDLLTEKYSSDLMQDNCLK